MKQRNLDSGGRHSQVTGPKRVDSKGRIGLTLSLINSGESCGIHNNMRSGGLDGLPDDTQISNIKLLVIIGQDLMRGQPSC